MIETKLENSDLPDMSILKYTTCVYLMKPEHINTMFGMKLYDQTYIVLNYHTINDMKKIH